MKTILIFGAYGFLGTNIIKRIDRDLSDRYRVITFDKFMSHPAGVTFKSVVRSYAGDFADERLISAIFAENKIDSVFHCISTTVPASAFNARYDIESNLVPTVGLLDIMIQNGVKDMVYLSSGGAIYGSDADRKHKECDDVFPISSYGVVKLAIEKYLMQYAELYGLRPLVLRLSNPYGPWHYSMKQGICNIALDKALSGEQMQIWGDGSASKDYVFVEDFTDILFKLIEKGVHTEVINLGSGELRSVNEILAAVKALVPDFAWTNTSASKLDVSRFALDTQKLLSIIGDFEFTPMDKGLQLTYSWTKNKC